MQFITQMGDKLKRDLVWHFHEDENIVKDPDFYSLEWFELKKQRILHISHVLQISHLSFLTLASKP